MSRKASEEAEPRTEEIDFLLEQARGLAERVGKLPDSPRKKQLKEALAELQAIAEQ